MSIGDMARAAHQRAYPPKDGAFRELGGAVPGSGNAKTAVADALSVVMAYIPTEIISIYVVALGVVVGTSGKEGAISTWTLYWLCLVATPVIVWIVCATKSKASGHGLPVAFKAWPHWEMFAAPVAFFAWASALPESPFQQCAWHTPGIGSLILVVASIALGLLGGLVK